MLSRGFFWAAREKEPQNLEIWLLNSYQIQSALNNQLMASAIPAHTLPTSSTMDSLR
jgi:hypothetical protein